MKKRRDLPYSKSSGAKPERARAGEGVVSREPFVVLFRGPRAVQSGIVFRHELLPHHDGGHVHGRVVKCYCWVCAVVVPSREKSLPASVVGWASRC